MSIYLMINWFAILNQLYRWKCNMSGWILRFLENYDEFSNMLLRQENIYDLKNFGRSTFLISLFVFVKMYEIFYLSQYRTKNCQKPTKKPHNPDTYLLFYQKEKKISKKLNGQNSSNSVCFLVPKRCHLTCGSFRENSGFDHSYHILMRKNIMKIEIQRWWIRYTYNMQVE